MFFSGMTQVSNDYRVDAGLIGAGLLQLVLSIATAFVGVRAVCEDFGVVDEAALHQITTMTVKNFFLQNSHKFNFFVFCSW